MAPTEAPARLKRSDALLAEENLPRGGIRNVSYSRASAGPFRLLSLQFLQSRRPIYVLRSRSELPIVAENRAILYKIGVMKSDVTRRLANARLDPIRLMADVKVVETYELFNINRARLENVIHRIFAPARADVDVRDRFGSAVIPREWFFVPLLR